MPGIWNRLSLRVRLLLLMAAMVVGAVLSGGLALQIFSPNQFEYENEQEANSARVVAASLNAALSAARNPEQVLDAFVNSLGSFEAIKYFPSGAAVFHPTAYVHNGKVPEWFISYLAIPELGAAYPIRIGTADVGNIVFSPDLSADIFEKWMGFLAIVSCSSALILLAAVSAYVTTGTALRPLTQLAGGLTRMRNGSFDHPIPVAGPPEIRQSCQEANQLALTLKHLSRDNRELLRKLVSVQDDERHELARELHDEMGPLLFAIRANATAFSDGAEGDFPEPGSPAHGILSAAEALQQANRRILEGLSPLYTTELGLDESIRALLRSAQSQAPDMRLSSRIDPHLNDLDGLLSQTTYRVIQEGMTNVLRHAQARAMKVEVTIENEQIAIEVSDDGVGLPQEVRFGRGLTGMNERVRALNGAFELSRQNGRTAVRCRLPLEQYEG